MAKSAAILLVEDEFLIAMDEKRQLEQRGYSVARASSGEEAVRLANDSALLDLILMDIDLGRGMDGAEAARRILDEREIPVLFLSSHTERDFVERTEAIANYGYVVKGSGITVLDASIKMALRLFEARAAMEEVNARLESEIADRRRVETELERFFELVPEMVCIASMDGYFKKLNREWERVLGHSLETLMGEPFVNFIHPDDREPTFREVERQLAGSTTIRFVNRYRTADGGWRRLEWNATPSIDGGLLFAAARDITDDRPGES